MAEYSIPNYNAVNFSLEVFTIPNYNAVNYELGASGNISNLPVINMAMTMYSPTVVRTTNTNPQVSNLPVINMVMTMFSPTIFTGDLNRSNLPVINMTMTMYAPTVVRTVDPTRIKFDTANNWFSFIVRGIEVGRLKENGDLDVHGTVNENAF